LFGWRAILLFFWEDVVTVSCLCSSWSTGREDVVVVVVVVGARLLECGGGESQLAATLRRGKMGAKFLVH
jgi:hypothetical protein